MNKGYLLSILFHLAVFLLLIININFLKPPKKLTYQKFSIHIGPVKKEPSTNLPKETPEVPQKKEIVESANSKTTEKKITKETPEVPQKKEIVESTNSKTTEKKITKEAPKNEDKKKPIIKKNNEVKEKVKELPPKEKKGEITKKNTTDTKKLSGLTKEKKVAKQEPIEDIFSKLVDNSEPINLNNTSAVLDENDLSKIQEQLKKHWNSTPCLDGMQTEVEIILDGNCNIIYRSLKNTSMSSAQLRACAESALKATQKTDKIELDDKSCKKYNQELMKIIFNK